MKKNLLFSIALLAPFMAFAMTDADKSGNFACVQVIQPAINANGECKQFSTPCEVPTDWKKVSSCSDFAKNEPKADIEDSTNRRISARWKALRAKAAKNSTKKEVKPTSFMRKALRMSSINTRGKLTSNDIKKKALARKAYAQKNWASKYKKYMSPLRTKALKAKEKKAQQQKETITKNLYKKVSGTAAITRKLHKSDKRLSNKFFSTQKAKRVNRFSTNSDTLKKALRWKNSFRKPKVKQAYTPKTVKLRQTYRGSGTGSLDS